MGLIMGRSDQIKQEQKNRNHEWAGTYWILKTWWDDEMSTVGGVDVTKKTKKDASLYG